MTDQAVDPAGGLFVVPLEEFTKRRNELAKQLKASGDREASEKVAKLTKPSVTAWALNKVAREQPGKIAELVKVDQAMAAPNSRTEMRQASGRRNRIVGTIVESASQILEDSGHSAGPGAAHRMTQTLLAVGTDAAARRLLVDGRLTKDLEPGGAGDAMWGPGPVLAGAEDEPDGPGDVGLQRRRKKLEEELRQLLQTADRLRDAAERAQHEAKNARVTAEKAEAAAERASRKAEGASAAVDRKRAELGAL